MKKQVVLTKYLVYSRENDCNLICTNVKFAFSAKSYFNITFGYFQLSFMYHWEQDVNWKYIWMFGRHPGRLLNVLYAFNLRPASRGVYTSRSEFHIFDSRTLGYFDVLRLWTCRLYFLWVDLGEWWNASASNSGYSEFWNILLQEFLLPVAWLPLRSFPLF